jgi:CRP/FNR family cyclic AMP-dependent transcriptional regulator
MVPNHQLSFDPVAFAARHGGASLRKFSKDQILYSQGDAADSIFYIEKGKIKLTVVSEHGKEAVVAMLEAGDFCGEECLAQQPLRISTATTMTECVATRLEKPNVLRALHGDLHFSEFAFTYLLTQNIRLKEQLVDHLFNSSEKRLARILLLLANYGKEEREEPITPKIDQETLAKMIGTTRPRVSQFMNKFRKLGFIEYNGHIKVHSALLSVVLHDQGVGSLSAPEVPES